MCEHRHDILTPVFAVQNKAICPGQAHAHISAHRALAMFRGHTSGDAQQPQNGVGGAREGTDPRRRIQEKSRGEVQDDCTFIAIAGARRGNAPLLFVPGIFKGRCLHAGSEEGCWAASRFMSVLQPVLATQVLVDGKEISQCSCRTPSPHFLFTPYRTAPCAHIRQLLHSQPSWDGATTFPKTHNAGTAQRGMETCALQPPTSSPQPADWQEQKTSFRVWHSTSPRLLLLRKKCMEVSFSARPQDAKPLRGDGAGKAGEYNAQGIGEKINKDYEGSGRVPCPHRRSPWRQGGNTKAR